MSDNVAVVRDFVAAWSRLDAAELMSYFADDCVYHNMPIEPIEGRAAVSAFIADFVSRCASSDWRLLNIAGAGDIVFAERLDLAETTDGKQVALPCCGVFELAGGKIRVWRDYFDLLTYTKAVAG